MRGGRAWKFGLGTLLLSVGALVSTTYGLHRQTPSVVQITTAPSVDVGGAHFVGTSNLATFHSDGDLLGNGNAVANIFVFDLKLRAKQGQVGLFQLTFGDQPSRNPTAARRGRTFAFESTADLLNNGSSGMEVFAAQTVKFRTGIVPLFQVTKADGSSFDPQLSENGRFLAFASTADLRGEALAPGVHLYRADLKQAELGEACPSYPCASSPGLELLTREVATNPAIDKIGRVVAFDSAGDVMGPGTSNGFSQIYFYDFDKNLMRRLTNGAGDSRHAVISRNGAKIFFESSADLTGTLNARFNIFEADIKKEPLQITQRTFGTDGDSTAVSVTPKAETIVFSSTADLTGDGPSVNDQLYLLEIDANRLTRLTSGSDDIGASAAQFTFFIFASSDDFANNGNTSPQLFLGNTFKLLDPSLPTSTPTPTVSATPSETAAPTATPTP